MKVLLLALALTMGTAAFAADYPANHCEVFIDRVQSYHGSHAARAIHVWVKTLSSRLDSAIAKVQLEVYDSTALKGWAVEMSPFAGSRDYWEMYPGQLFIGGDYYVSKILNVKVVATTVRGTRYVSSAADGKLFVLDDNMVNNLDRLRHSSLYQLDQSRAVPTADAFPYLNPGHCR